ncbi:RNA methyltransferase [Candidatus Pelagibacter bacterium]|jgi:tRNA/rRNA methyltransferase|nr:RNA methyltransferase [Candidatus Pelagibacter bacterium]
MKNKFGFILVKPQLGENIGACARSMKNFGFSKLHIVSPKINFPNHKAKATSVGAFDIINKAKVFNDTNEAISNFDIVISLSARKRDINKRHISLEEFGNLIKKKNNSNFGLMFGPEASGLSNQDLSFSNYILQIPTSLKFKSLNLSHSVTIICYEIFKIFNKNLLKSKKLKIKIAPKSKINSLIKHLVGLLENKDFFTPKEKKQSMLLNINNLIYRLEPNDKELRILASIISTLSKKKYESLIDK